METPIVQCYV